MSKHAKKMAGTYRPARMNERRRSAVVAANSDFSPSADDEPALLARVVAAKAKLSDAKDELEKAAYSPDEAAVVKPEVVAWKAKLRVSEAELEVAKHCLRILQRYLGRRSRLGNLTISVWVPVPATLECCQLEVETQAHSSVVVM
jgi:hypothetical protein